MTKKRATLEGDGREFDAVKAERLGGKKAAKIAESEAEAAFSTLDV